MNDVARRKLLTGLASLPLATVLANPHIAKAVAAGLEEVKVATPSGRTVQASLAVPGKVHAPAVMLIHEWWGLNDQIKAVAAELAKEGYLALAVDLYDGKSTTLREEAQAYMQGVVREDAQETLETWVSWLRANARVQGGVGTVGWCFGGGWSLNASIDSPVEATVVYYGRVNQPEDELANLKSPVLGHFATKDQWINQEMVDGFEANMNALGKSYEVFWYEAEHGFANPTSSRYDEKDAKQAWERTVQFFKDNL
ncbi:MAG: dienelactone hydrolase family protein [Pseudomonadota bacterium]